MRLDKCLATMGIGARSYVKELIRSGAVSVNGKVCKAPETSVSEDDGILVNGKPLEHEDFEYYILYKPAGYLSACEDPRKPVVMELVPSKRTDLFPVGRLDFDTEGLLLITNDGELNHRLLSPKYKVPKKYYAELDADLPPDAKEKLSRPIVFQDFTSEPAVLEVIDLRHAYLTVTEGKYHEVKRLFHAIGCDVVYLRRETFGKLSLSGLKRGEIRKITKDEIE
ncbi:MAG: rRNA pseudouridine synthase [Lachnospiraceae bacterium]|nr:rRNA pseudouridine synthase [Lachnospiraceae bacterium]